MRFRDRIIRAGVEGVVHEEEVVRGVRGRRGRSGVEVGRVGLRGVLWGMLLGRSKRLSPGREWCLATMELDARLLSINLVYEGHSRPAVRTHESYILSSEFKPDVE